MAKYVLTKPHFIARPVKQGEPPATPVYMETGTVLEDWDDPPSLGMEGVDDDGKAKCKERDEKRDQSKQEAISSGRMSKVTAENIGPKTEKPPPDFVEEEDEPAQRGRRPTRR